MLVNTKSGGRLAVAVSTSRIDATVTRLRLAVYAAGGLVAVVLIASGFWVQRLGLRALERPSRPPPSV